LAQGTDFLSNDLTIKDLMDKPHPRWSESKVRLWVKKDITLNHEARDLETIWVGFRKP